MVYSSSIARHFHSPLVAFQRGVFAPAKRANILVLAVASAVVAGGFGDTLQSPDRLSRLEIWAALGSFWNVSQGVLVVTIHPLLLAFGVGDEFGLSAGFKFK
ncbi:MAG: hypothetical protein WD733_11630 [Bryobacterales bacterium]